ncbi:MAG: hypothetical protein IMF10_02805 [Proteobacteria bacterium]|nr:hypothetical protein [Pseudomonadota bacterium]
MDLGDLVIINNPGHSHYGKRGKIVGRRGERAPGDPWFLVYVMMRGRSYLLPGSMLEIVEEKTDDKEILIWPLSGKVTRKAHRSLYRQKDDETKH